MNDAASDARLPAERAGAEQDRASRNGARPSELGQSKTERARTSKDERAGVKQGLDSRGGARTRPTIHSCVGRRARRTDRGRRRALPGERSFREPLWRVRSPIPSNPARIRTASLKSHWRPIGPVRSRVETAGLEFRRFRERAPGGTPHAWRFQDGSDLASAWSMFRWLRFDRRRPVSSRRLPRHRVLERVQHTVVGGRYEQIHVFQLQGAGFPSAEPIGAHGLDDDRNRIGSDHGTSP